ncbi:hypothetical protein EYF80_031527 [Liparis tanakae]|uniref:Uncharacterized protein n=1 Tax=Liparis tanakae TaxID=230148 RepID=A0A4Z2GXA9_9TELE|nr:hypothetical protein EYF80_031527 [Liparis tanakae]
MDMRHSIPANSNKRFLHFLLRILCSLCKESGSLPESEGTLGGWGGSRRPDVNVLIGSTPPEEELEAGQPGEGRSAWWRQISLVEAGQPDGGRSAWWRQVSLVER